MEIQPKFVNISKRFSQGMSAQCKELEKLVEKASDNTSRLEVLEYVKDSSMRVPNVVRKLGEEILRQSGNLKGSVEYWDVMEQVAISCMDLGDVSSASKWIKQIFVEFPSSQRALRLAIMLHEAKGEYAEALKQYERILSSDPLDMKTWRRKICTIRASGDLSGAISELVKYVDLFPLDIPSWQYLGELSMCKGDLSTASFALEELLLLEPVNYVHHLKYAELLYTINAKKNAEIARHYYCEALVLCPGNVRALMGLQLCLKISGTTGRLNTALYKSSKSALCSAYAGSSLSELALDMFTD